MKTVPLLCYLDAFSGISGDMLVGALADAGAAPAAIVEALASLETGAVLSFERVQRCGIAATKFHSRAGQAASLRGPPVCSPEGPRSDAACSSVRESDHSGSRGADARR